MMLLFLDACDVSDHVLNKDICVVRRQHGEDLLTRSQAATICEDHDMHLLEYQSVLEFWLSINDVCWDTMQQ